MKTWSQLSVAQKVFTIATTVIVLGVFNAGCIYHASWLSIAAVAAVDLLAIGLGVKLASK